MARILIVDDEPDVRFLLKVVFEGAGHEVIEAANGEAALVCMAQQPAIVVTDLMMPVMDGNELIRRIRADGSMSAIPILAVTANPSGVVGADAVVKKPFGRNEILGMIDELVQDGEAS